jgi:hypothetical protein
LKYFGTHQDGALHHNNPGKIALWERKYIWPDKAESQPDFVLSIGTGLAVKRDITRLGPFSPAMDSCFSRIRDAFSWNIDAEQAWKDIMNFTPAKYHDRYHRVNLPMDTDEPSIDDIAIIDALQEQTRTTVLDGPELISFKENLIASMFYFRPTSVTPEEDGYVCTGVIVCRLDLSKAGRQALHRALFDAGSYFLINGSPIPCFKSKPVNKPFRRQIKFAIDDLDDSLYISLHRQGKTQWQISGLPQSVRKLADAQGLFAQFGRSDHRTATDRTSRLPQKRAFGTF